jgi:hypothetical protein
LQVIIDASPCGEMTFLVNDLGRPFTDAGFGNWFRDRCVEAGVPGRAHGLRKAGATIAANNGATAHQLMAMFGWRMLKMAEQHTRAADQQRLAEAAMHMLDTREQTGTESCPTVAPGGTFSAKTEAKSKGNFGGGAQERTGTPLLSLQKIEGAALKAPLSRQENFLSPPHLGRPRHEPSLFHLAKLARRRPKPAPQPQAAQKAQPQAKKEARKQKPAAAEPVRQPRGDGFAALKAAAARRKAVA